MKRLLNFPNIILSLPIIAGLILIWMNLDLRPLHHDESLNAIYGLYYYLNPASQFYKYDPMLHGPLLYHLLPWVYHILDESHFAVRFIPALLFSLIPVGVIIILRKRIGWLALAIAALLITGPSYIYWARFLRHDQLVLFLFLIIGFSFYSSSKKISPYLFLIPFFLQFCVKENAYINLLFWIGFIVFNYLVNKKDLFILKHLTTYKKHLIISIFIGIFFYIFYYSAEFKYSTGILDGLYRKSLSYWFNQHSVERISGPFLTQFFTLFWYELPFILILFSSVIHLHLKSKTILRYLPLVILIIASVLHLIYGQQIPSTSLWNKLAKLKIGLDFYGFFFFLILSISGTWLLIKTKRPLPAFFYYWTMASFFTYSFLGEKVPWLSIYILIPGVIFIGIYLKDINSKILIPCLSLALFFNIYQAIQLNHINTGSNTEFISQVHTTRDYEQLSFKLKSLLEKKDSVKILALKDNTWPLTWYLYGLEGYHYNQMGKQLRDFDIILDSSPTSNEVEGYSKKVIGLRHWWVPNWRRMKFADFLQYPFTHKPWNPSGTQKITVFYKEGLLNF